MRIETWVNHLACQIAEQLQYDEEKKQVMAYGLFTLVHTLLAIGTTILVGWLCGVFFESLIISFSTALLRKPSGGVHTSSPSSCIVLGTIVAVVGAVGCQFWSHITVIQLLVLVVISFTYGYYVIAKKAPVDSKAKPIRTETKRKRLKKRSLVTLTLYLSIVVTNLLAFYIVSNQKFLTYGLCILVGMSWQVFSLTDSGHWLVKQFDRIFINRSILKKRRK